MIDRVAAWIVAQACPARASPRAFGQVAPLPSTVQEAGVRETALTVSAGGTDLFAILSEPATGRVRRAVLVLNTGSARRIGASRMHVDWSRAWARAGIAVLRLDLPGLGDSGVQPGETEGEAYLIDSAAAIDAALALLRARFGKTGCMLMGICSGAYHAYRAALGGAAIESLVLINQAAYRWRPGMRLEDPSTALRLSWQLQANKRDGKVAACKRTLPSVCSDLKWRAIQTGYAALGALRDATRLLGWPLPGDVGAELRTLARRGVALHLLLAEHDFCGPLLDLEAGRTVAALQRSGEIHRELIADADHIFTTRSARARLRAALGRIVQGPVLQPRSLRTMANAATAAVPTAANTRSISR
jgi:alpha-beta hydrolase superfamily lysophospholipase